MDICDMKFSTGEVLVEQIARQLFEALPEQGVAVAIVGHDGVCRQSSPEEFARLGLDETVIAELRARVDDGVEPVVIHLGDASVTMGQLTTDRTDCGYAVVAVSRCAAKPVVSDITLLEALLGQISLIARLIETNRLLLKTQIGYVSGVEVSEGSLN